MKKLIGNIKALGFASIGILAFVFILCLISINLSTTGTLLTFWEMSLPEHYSSATMTYNIFSTILVVLFFASFLPLGFGVMDIFRKKSAALYTLLAFELVFLFAQLSFHLFVPCLGGGSLAIIVIGILLLAGAFFLLIVRSRAIEAKDKQEGPKADLPLKAGKQGRWVLIVSIVQVLLTGLIFFVPNYVQVYGATSVSHSLINTPFSASPEILDVVYFLFGTVFFIALVAYFVYSISFYISDKAIYVHHARIISFLALGLTLAFFVSGYATCFAFASQGVSCTTYSFIPLILVGISFVVFSIFSGRFDLYSGIPSRKRTSTRKEVEALVYFLILVIVTVCSMFLNVLVVNISYDAYSYSVSLTGFQLLQDYATLGSGYQVLAFYLAAMLLVSGLSLLWTLCCFFSKYEHFGTVLKVSSYINFAMILALGVSGLYFAIAKELNIESMKSLLAYYKLTYSTDYVYDMRTDTVYALAIDVVIFVIIYFRKAFANLDGPASVPSKTSVPSPVSAISEAAPATSTSEPSAPSRTSEPSETSDEPDIDPCPAFTMLDEKIPEMENDLLERRKLLVKEPSLESLVSFVVDYARRSRLHLSYSKEDIADFVAGLGAARLTILQGMSGTGKTSLPKIFMEAIYGNCFLVEVESSWKDKNELLGYYNEFSGMYTPRKFTQALYTSTLEKDVPTFIVLDEMNLSRIEYYFSDFLSLMENEEGKREIKLTNVRLERPGGVPYDALTDGCILKVPSNVWFIGTANRDESTFVISDKVYDRAHTMNFNKRAPKVRGNEKPIDKSFFPADVLMSLFDNAKKNGGFDCEKNQVISKVEQLLAPYNISFGNRILNQIEDFVDIYRACFPGVDVLNQAVESILLSKVVTKLETKTIDDKESLVRAFEDLGLYRCVNFVNGLNED